LRSLRPWWASRSLWAGITLRACRTNFTLRPGWTHFALHAARSFQAWRTLRACRTGRANGAGITLRACRTGRANGAGITLRPWWASQSLWAGIALGAFVVPRHGVLGVAALFDLIDDA